jgi:hypothetical protein
MIAKPVIEVFKQVQNIASLCYFRHLLLQAIVIGCSGVTRGLIGLLKRAYRIKPLLWARIPIAEIAFV